MICIERNPSILTLNTYLYLFNISDLVNCVSFSINSRYQSNLKRKTTKSQRIHPTAEKPQNQFNQFTMTKNYLMTMMGMTMTLQLQCPEDLEKPLALVCVSKPWS